jgi:hypothetical protein
MATIGNSFLGLIDLYKRSGQYGEIVPVIEALAVLNPVMQDAITVECNKGTTHLTTTRTGLPSVGWGMLYQGIVQSKSTTQQVEDTTGFVEGLSTVDKRLLDLSSDPAAVRMSEAQPYLESMSQEMQTGFFYHDTASAPTKIKGISPRYSTYAPTPSTVAGSANNVIHGGGSGSDNTSIWFVTWGEQQTSLIVPKGMPAGLQREDKGEQRVLDDLSRPYFVKEELFTQHAGVTVRDYRWNSRIANIDVSDVRAGSVDLYALMRKAYYRLQGRRNSKLAGDGMVSMGRTVIYMNSDMLEALDALGTNTGNTALQLRPVELEGQEVLTYRGMVIRETEALVNTETLVPVAS